MATLEAEGIDGSTLLGFLAAVGSLRLLTEAHSGARLWFDRCGDHAMLEAGRASSCDAVVEAIIERFRSPTRDRELGLLAEAEKPKDISAEMLEALSRAAREHPQDGAFVAGLICDGLTKDKNSDKAAETILCAANGSGHQDMFTTMRDLRRLVTDEHVRSSLVKPWEFGDEVPPETKWMGDRKPTLRWDEGSERIYALRLRDPTDKIEPFRTQLGAYALAAAALPCFPVVPQRRGAATVSTNRESSTQVDFYWMLWERPATLAMVKVMHAIGEALTDPASARRRGVYRLLRARRMTLDKGKLVFSPSEAVW